VPANADERGTLGPMFDAIAPAYDRLNGDLSLGIDRLWRRRLVAGVLKEHPQTLLDLATGTGDVAIALAAALPSLRVTGLDFSSAMLDLARPKAEAAGVSERIALVPGDAAALPFPDAGFDAVTVAFGVRNFPDRLAALSEMSRVLVPGGSVHILEFDYPKNPLWRAAYTAWSRVVIPPLGGLVSGQRAAYRYLTASIRAFSSEVDLPRELLAAGFTVTADASLSGGIARLLTAHK